MGTSYRHASDEKQLNIITTSIESTRGFTRIKCADKSLGAFCSDGLKRSGFKIRYRIGRIGLIAMWIGPLCTGRQLDLFHLLRMLHQRTHLKTGGQPG